MEKDIQSLKNIERFLSTKLVKVLKTLNIECVNFIVIGNSLSTGYSMSDSIAPFFDQNDILKKVLINNGIKVNSYNFATPTNNSNEIILDNINKDRSIEYIKQVLARQLKFDKAIDLERDFYFQDVIMYRKEGIIPLSTIKKEIYEKYYKIKEEDKDITINNIIKSKNSSTQNIVIFNGCTGELMDTIFRGGSIFETRSHLKLEMINLSKILTELLNKDEDIIITVGSIPKFTLKNIPLFSPIIDPYNKIISNRVREIPNSYITYPTRIELLHKKNNKLVLDCHGNQLEYNNLTNSFIRTINKNIIPKDIATAYRKVIKEEIERLYISTDKFDMDIIINMIEEIFKNKSSQCYKYKNDLIKGIKDFLYEYFKYYHIYYFPTDKEKVETLLKKQQNILNRV
ncbi:MAG TPA: hypothetical protein PKY25_00455 [Bacilli bacterium]|nr:hypothetical protein [Bacilli bacterium]